MARTSQAAAVGWEVSSSSSNRSSVAMPAMSWAALAGPPRTSRSCAAAQAHWLGPCAVRPSRA
ncbi:hypothetical protein LUX34_00515 [Streptomyces werraensis]|nr:hypothetical protein [Streptomyces werraensis]